MVKKISKKLKKKVDLYNEIAKVIMHYKTCSGELMQDVIKRGTKECDSAYGEIFDLTHAIREELEKVYEFKVRKKYDK